MTIFPILGLCTKHLDDTIYSSWDIERDRLKLIIFNHFLPFYPSKTKKKQNFEKIFKNAGDIIILYVHQKSYSNDVQFLR